MEMAQGLCIALLAVVIVVVVVGEEYLQNAKAKNHHQHEFLSPRQLEGTDDGYGHDEESKVGNHIYARHDIPHRLEVHAVAGHRPVPKRLDGGADQWEHDRECNGPGAEKDEKAESDVPQKRLEEDSPVLQHDGDLGETYGHVVDNDGAEEGLGFCQHEVGML